MAERDDDFEADSGFEPHADAVGLGGRSEHDDEPEHDDSLAIAVAAAGGGWEDDPGWRGKESFTLDDLEPQDLSSKVSSDEDTYNEPDAELEAIVRRERDVKLMAAVREHGVDCWQFDELEQELTKYASSVVKAWLTTGQIFYQAKKNGIKGVPEPSPRELDCLRQDEGIRDAIADELIVKGLVRFEKQIEARTGWDPEGGAALPTYFLKNCLFSLKDAFNKHIKIIHIERPLLDSHLSTKSTPADDPDNPEGHLSRIEDHIRIDTLINMLADREQRVVRGIMAGLTPQEIVELNDDIPSPGALRAIRQRIRNRNAWIELITGEEE